MKYTIKGFPQIGHQIEMPNTAELLVSPMFNGASFEDAYKHGSEAIRYLLDHAPIKNDKKYVSVMCRMQMLTPNVRSILNFIKSDGDEWHMDGDNLWNEDRFHMILSDCTALTEFNTEEIEIGVTPSARPEDINRLVNEHNLGLKPATVYPNAFVTFTTHIHRRTQPQRTEFRFWMRVDESDSIVPKPFKYAVSDVSHVVSPTGAFRKGAIESPNIVRLSDRIIIHLEGNTNEN